MSDETRLPPGEGRARSAPPGEGQARPALPGDDVVRRAARALREREGGDPPAGRTTKADVLRALAPPTPPHRARPFAIAGLAAALAMSTAWAASGRLPDLGAFLARTFGAPPEPTLVPETLPPPAPRAPAERNAVAADDRAALDAAAADDRAAIAGAEGSPRRADSAPAATGAPSRAGDAPTAVGNPPRADRAPAAPVTTPTAAPEAPAPKRDDRPAPPPRRGQAPPPATGVGAPKPAGNVAPAPPPATTASAPPPAASPNADELYEQAHRAHFSGRDMAAALAAWDRYLAAAPRGRFALEARYNRALALSRLGRRDEAARALEPFAAGDFGAYRQAEARRLLESLRGAPRLPPGARTGRRCGHPALTPRRATPASWQPPRAHPRGARARVSAGAAAPAPSGRGR